VKLSSPPLLMIHPIHASSAKNPITSALREGEKFTCGRCRIAYHVLADQTSQRVALPKSQTSRGVEPLKLPPLHK
jgi:hypothetical protein